MRLLSRAAVVTAALSFVPTCLLAEDVTLHARSGSLSVSGSLIAFDGETYRLQTQFGALSVEAEAVDCEGPGCPHMGGFSATIRLAAEPWVIEKLLLPKVADYADTEGLGMTREAGTDRIRLDRRGGPELTIEVSPLADNWQAALLADELDVALTPATESTGLKQRLLAHLPMAVVTGPEAPQGRLSWEALDQLRRGDSGWTSLGQPERPVVWHGLTGTAITGGEYRPASDFAALRKALQQDPWGIALLPRDEIGDLPERRIAEDCGFEREDGSLPLASGDDPLRLSLYWSESGPRLPAHARRLAAHLTANPATSPFAAPALGLAESPARLFNAAVDPNPQLTQAQRREALLALASAKRLPHTFRFGAGGTLDRLSQEALTDLAQRLTTAEESGVEYLLIGFAAGPEAGTASLRLAERVRDLLSEHLAASEAAPTLRPSPLGFGQALPLRCHESADAASVNTRVELWLRPQVVPE